MQDDFTIAMMLFGNPVDISLQNLPLSFAKHDTVKSDTEWRLTLMVSGTFITAKALLRWIAISNTGEVVSVN